MKCRASAMPSIHTFSVLRVKMKILPLISVLIAVLLVGCGKEKMVEETIRLPDGTTLKREISASEQKRILEYEMNAFQQVKIVIENDNSLTVDGKKHISDEELVALLSEQGEKPKTAIIFPSEEASAVRVVQTIDLAKNAGIESISIATKVNDE